MSEFLKAEQISNAKWRVLSIPFGGPFDGKDFDGEFFTKRTDIKSEWFDRRPLVWHHNMDGTMKADPVLGTADDTDLEPDGWWSTLWLNKSHQYWAKVDKLLRQGKLYGSSGTLSHFVNKDRKSGEILVWPFIEQSMSPVPVNPYSRIVASKALEHFDDAGLSFDLDSLTADLPPDLPTGGEEAAKRRLLGIANVQLARLRTL